MDPGRGELTDEALREEIELVGELVVAASACSGRMSQEDVDSVLGVSHHSDGAPPAAPPEADGRRP